MEYRRALFAGGIYFFTLTLQDRRSQLLTENIEALRAAIRKVQVKHPFNIIAMVVMPDHLHAIWQLPEGDANFSMRWSLIKAGFSRALPKTETIADSRQNKRERGIWQRRFWEHVIRDDTDLENHIAYIHFNPVKHGYVQRAADWSYSSIHRYIARGELPQDWGIGTTIEEPNAGE
jgi:putative transposase